VGTLFRITAGLGIGGGGRKDWRYAQDALVSLARNIPATTLAISVT
jgi:hypothetical protein